MDNLVVRLARQVRIIEAARREAREALGFYSDLFSEACNDLDVPEPDRTGLCTDVYTLLQEEKREKIAMATSPKRHRGSPRKKGPRSFFRGGYLPG